MFVPSWPDAILGTLELVFALVFLAALAMRVYGAVARFLYRLRVPSNIDLTLNQMNVRVDECNPDTSPYAATRNARQSLKRGG